MNISETNSTSEADQLTEEIYAASCSLNLILSVPINGYILWLIVNGAGGTMSSEFFTLNMAVSEILFCMFSVLFIVNTQIPSTALSDLGTFGLSFLLTGRPLFQCCICVERYLAVVHPVTFLKYKPLRYRVGCCGAVWLMVFGDGLFLVFLAKSLISNIVSLILNLLLLCVMLFCCLSVLRVLKQPGPGEGDREGSKHFKMRAFMVILIILVSMLLSYLSVIVIAALYVVLDYDGQIMSYSICFCILLISGFVQPLFYLHRAGKLPCIRAN